MYTPNDGANWMLAKLNVQVTDLGYGQIVEHLAKVQKITASCALNNSKHANEGNMHEFKTRTSLLIFKSNLMPTYSAHHKTLGQKSYEINKLKCNGSVYWFDSLNEYHE